MRLGRRVAIDVGKARIGIAASDYHGILASPLTTVLRSADLANAIQAVSEAVASVDPIEIYVGLPINLSGISTESTSDALRMAQALQRALNTSVRMVDERLSTVAAAGQLRISGKNSRQGKQVVDQIAATVILESALATEKNSGKQPGVDIGEFDV